MKNQGVFIIKTVKVCFLGSDGVGKTSIILRYIRNTFSTSYLATLGCDFYDIALENQGIPYQAYIWDIASQNNFKKMRSYYLSHSNLVVICCDINRITDEFITPWILESQNYISNNVKYLFAINKIDLEPVQSKLHLIKNQLEQKYHVQVVLTSAKTGENIALLFKSIGDKLSESE